MNEQIKVLMEQAGILEWPEYKPDIVKVLSKKQVYEFAELIVQECIKQCSKALVEYTGQPSATHNYAVGLCQDSIKEHFYGDQSCQ